MTQSRPRGVRYVLLSILGGLFLLLGCVCALAGLLYGVLLLVAAQFFPGGRWDGMTEDVVIWVISLVVLFGLSRLSYAWATDPEPVLPAAGDRSLSAGEER
jgi:hypothetical protein